MKIEGFIIAPSVGYARASFENFLGTELVKGRGELVKDIRIYRTKSVAERAFDELPHGIARVSGIYKIWLSDSEPSNN